MLTYHQKAQILARNGYDEQLYENAVAPPIFQTVNFCYGENIDGKYRYTPSGNPTMSIVSEKLAAVESGKTAKLFSTGMAAIHAVFLNFLQFGDHIIVSNSVYHESFKFLKIMEDKFGIKVTEVSGEANTIETAVTDATKMIFIESPSSKFFDILDLEAIGNIGKRRHIMLVIDNTWATPMFQNPLLYGFNLVIHSTTKYMSGHNDISGGAVIGSKALIERLNGMGASMDPHQAWLLNRSLMTLPMRMTFLMESAMQVAEFLESHPKIEKVLYPGLPSHPQYQLGKRQMTGYSSLFSFFTKGSYEQSLQVMNRFKLIKQAWSYGGPTSLIMHNGYWFRSELQRRGYSQNFLRLHVGFEDPAELIADLDHALQAIDL